jgi:hypothetical protein
MYNSDEQVLRHSYHVSFVLNSEEEASDLDGGTWTGVV